MMAWYSAFTSDCLMYSPLSFFRAVRRLRMLQRGTREEVRRVGIRASGRTHLITASRMGSSVLRSVADQPSVGGGPPRTHHSPSWGTGALMLAYIYVGRRILDVLGAPGAVKGATRTKCGCVDGGGAERVGESQAGGLGAARAWDDRGAHVGPAAYGRVPTADTLSSYSSQARRDTAAEQPYADRPRRPLLTTDHTHDLQTWRESRRCALLIRVVLARRTRSRGGDSASNPSARRPTTPSPAPRRQRPRTRSTSRSCSRRSRRSRRSSTSCP